MKWCKSILSDKAIFCMVMMILFACLSIFVEEARRLTTIGGIKRAIDHEWLPWSLASGCIAAAVFGKHLLPSFVLEEGPGWYATPVSLIGGLLVAVLSLVFGSIVLLLLLGVYFSVEKLELMFDFSTFLIFPFLLIRVIETQWLALPIGAVGGLVTCLIWRQLKANRS